MPAQQSLHTPEAAAGKDRAFRGNRHIRSSPLLLLVSFRNSIRGTHHFNPKLASQRSAFRSELRTRDIGWYYSAAKHVYT
jgi:hypothetical protein